jgi:hypothetical protein
MDWDVVKTFVSLDGQRRVEIVRRHDGFFSFEEDQWTSEFGNRLRQNKCGRSTRVGTDKLCPPLRALASGWGFLFEY